jgi:hypothetical protein
MIALICTILFAPDTDNNRDMKRHLAAIRHAILHIETPSGILLFKLNKVLGPSF